MRFRCCAQPFFETDFQGSRFQHGPGAMLGMSKGFFRVELGVVHSMQHYYSPKPMYLLNFFG